MRGMTVSESVKAFGLDRILKTIRTDPQRTLPRLMRWIDRVMPAGAMETQRGLFRDILRDPNNPWNKFAMSMWEDVDDGCREAVLQNFCGNAAAIG